MQLKKRISRVLKIKTSLLTNRVTIVLMVMLLMPLFMALPQDIRDEDRRQIFNINQGWSYLEDHLPRVEDLPRSTKHWEKINLPHTWNRTDAVDQVPGYRRSASWYRKSLFIPASSSNLRYFLEFEGVNITSEVYVNGFLAGGHIGGYLGFSVDMTPFVKHGESNTILVRADNSYDPDVIPSQKSDFHIYGGITRDVRLNVLPVCRIDRLLIKTPSV